MTTLASGSGCLPSGCFSISIMFVLLSVSVTMAPLPSFPTMVSISQSAKRVPSASAGRWCMLTRSGIFLTLVVRSGLPCLLYFILCRQCEVSSPLSSARIWRYMSSWEIFLPRLFISVEICSGDQSSSLSRSRASQRITGSFAWLAVVRLLRSIAFA